MTASSERTEEPEGLDSYETEALGQRRLGTVIAQTYRLERCVGAGASSHVFEATHLRLQRKFAVKVLRAELDCERAALRFRREATAIARLRCEHVVSVVDCGELEDRTPYLVMELLEGEDLRRLLSHSAPLPARRAVALALEACRGLGEVHRAGLVHRDLKPENLFIARRSTGQDWCKILDFGVARMDAGTGTAHGALIGTVRYMAPEQLLDSSALGPEADIYALGAILFECLTGRPLVGGASVQESMYRIINASPRELMGATELPAPLERVIAACLEKSPNRRPASAAELAERLVEAMAPQRETDVTLAEYDAESAPGRELPPLRRSPRVLATLALVIFSAGALAGWQVAPRSVAQRAASAGAASPVPKPSAAPSPALAAVTSAAPSLASSATSPLVDVVKRGSPPTKRSSSPAPATPRSPSAGPLDRFDQVNPYGD